MEIPVIGDNCDCLEALRRGRTPKVYFGLPLDAVAVVARWTTLCTRLQMPMPST